MAKNYFDRYVWLIDTINRNGHITKKEIDERWRVSPLNERRDRELPERTFHNHRQAILDTFGIEIKCDRSLGYYIANGDDLDGEEIRSWLLQSLSMNNLLNESADMRDRILFEKIPSSQQWLSVIVHAMRDGKAVELTYQSFHRGEERTFTAHPYCVKLFKQRWYMLACSEGYDAPRIYALDARTKQVRPLEKKSVMPKKFDAQAYFADHFGIISGGGESPEIVEIKVTAGQVRYVETLPLHHSQTLVEETPEYSIYRYRLVPTYDFEQEILSHGPDFEVLCPESFREKVKADIVRMYKNYGL